MPHGLHAVIAYGIITLFTFILIIHWLRRSFRHPEPNEPDHGRLDEEPILFDRFQRFFHWSITISFVGVFITGFALFDPFTFEPFADLLGIPLHTFFPEWVAAHIVFSAVYFILVIAHIAWDVFKLHAMRRMLPTRRDLIDSIHRILNFFGLSKIYPRMNKYDFFMKMYHIYLAISLVVLAFTGIFQYLYSPWWLYPWYLHFQIEPTWRPTVLHDLFGFILIALVIGHLYFSILPINRPLLSAMIRGKLARSEVKRRYRAGEFKG